MRLRNNLGIFCLRIPLVGDVLLYWRIYNTLHVLFTVLLVHSIKNLIFLLTVS